MECIADEHLRSHIIKLFRDECLDRGFRCDRHECRSVNDSMVRHELSGSRTCILIFMDKFVHTLPEDQHRIPEAVKPVGMGYRPMIPCKSPLTARKSACKHQKRGFR